MSRIPTSLVGEWLAEELKLGMVQPGILPQPLVQMMGSYLPSFCDVVTDEGKLCGHGKDNSFTYETKYGDINCINECQFDYCLPWLQFVFDHLPQTVSLLFSDGRIEDRKIQTITIDFNSVRYSSYVNNMWTVVSEDGGTTWKYEQRMMNSANPWSSKLNITGKDIVKEVCDTTILLKTDPTAKDWKTNFQLEFSLEFESPIEIKEFKEFEEPSRIYFPNFQDQIFFKNNWRRYYSDTEYSIRPWEKDKIDGISNNIEFGFEPPMYSVDITDVFEYE